MIKHTHAPKPTRRFWHNIRNTRWIQTCTHSQILAPGFYGRKRSFVTLLLHSFSSLTHMWILNQARPVRGFAEKAGSRNHVVTSCLSVLTITMKLGGKRNIFAFILFIEYRWNYRPISVKGQYRLILILVFRSQIWLCSCQIHFYLAWQSVTSCHDGTNSLGLYTVYTVLFWFFFRTLPVFYNCSPRPLE